MCDPRIMRLCSRNPWNGLLEWQGWAVTGTACFGGGMCVIMPGGLQERRLEMPNIHLDDGFRIHAAVWQEGVNTPLVCECEMLLK